MDHLGSGLHDPPTVYYPVCRRGRCAAVSQQQRSDPLHHGRGIIQPGQNPRFGRITIRLGQTNLEGVGVVVPTSGGDLIGHPDPGVSYGSCHQPQSRLTL